jgi:hypothetical protein
MSENKRPVWAIDYTDKQWALLIMNLYEPYSKIRQFMEEEGFITPDLDKINALRVEKQTYWDILNHSIQNIPKGE